MPATYPIPQEPKNNSDSYSRNKLRFDSRTIAARPLSRPSNGATGAAVAGRRLSGGARTRGGQA
jgi:hypothetical protein